MTRSSLWAATGVAALTGALIVGAPKPGAAQAPSGPKPPPGNTAPRTQVVGAPVAVAPGTNGIAIVTCPAGATITGGGGQTSAFDIFFTDSFASGNGWVIRGSNRGSTTQNLNAVATCLSLGVG